MDDIISKLFEMRNKGEILCSDDLVTVMADTCCALELARFIVDAKDIGVGFLILT